MRNTRFRRYFLATLSTIALCATAAGTSLIMTTPAEAGTIGDPLPYKVTDLQAKYLELNRSVSKTDFLALNPDAAPLAECEAGGIVAINGYASRPLDCVELAIMSSLENNSGRVTSAEFDPKLYRALYKDLPSTWSEYDLALHYDNDGMWENRTASLCEDDDVYDYVYYSDNTPDLAAAGIYLPDELCDHFYAHGLDEGRAGSAQFSVRRYQELNSDLAGFSGRDAAIHYLQYGRSEGRRVS